MLSKAVVLGALAATVAANAHVDPAHFVGKPAMQARQTDEAGAQKCLSQYMSVYSAAPTPPPDLAAYEANNPPTDFCSYTVPSSLASELTSYELQLKSWVSDNIQQISALATQCPIYSAVTSSPSCWATNGIDALASTSASAGANATRSAATTTSTSSRATANSGPRETGMAAAAIAVAGLFGAVAL